MKLETWVKDKIWFPLEALAKPRILANAPTGVAKWDEKNGFGYPK
ncbi:MAG: hypothetical protein NTV80_14045 [Verrucomicrobia bacterium]|nr:hypothetical protein [Verrucomicrobiota bacterium]